MQILRYCQSCAGPRPRAARRCPWCQRSYDLPPGPPEHLFASFDRRTTASRGSKP